MYKCFENVYTKLSEKVTVFKKYLLLKKFVFWKSSCSEEVRSLIKYMFWVIIYSEEKAPPKQQLYWKRNYLK